MSTQLDANTGLSATVISLVDTQSVTRTPSVPMMPPLQPIRPSVTSVATMVHNTTDDTVQPPCTGNTSVLVCKRGWAKIIINNTRVSGSFSKLIPNLKGPNLRRVREQLFNTVLQSISTTKYTICYDNGMEYDCISSIMMIVQKDVRRLPNNQ